LPLQFLPAAWVPLAVKLFAAALAAAILGLVARTVQLLPWDHSWEKAGRLACALPGLTAVVICGLEFNFWQEATSTCRELLDLLLVTSAVWLLLEYNVRQKRGWLGAAAVVWGAGMAENWVMLLTLPLFVAAVIRLEGLRFFQLQFMLWLAGLGLAGFSIYAVQPLANGLMPHGVWTMGESWRNSFYQTKGVALQLYYLWRGHRLLVLAVLIYFLVPTLPLLIRTRDEGTHNRSGVDRFQIWLYRALRLGLLLACFWLAFDPAPGARQMLYASSIRLPLLTLDYLVALGAAFLVGNLLLIPHIVSRDEYRRSRNPAVWQRSSTFAWAAALALIAGGLLWRNAPAIMHGNFHPLERFGDLAVTSLPPGRGVILSDDPDRLIVFRAALARGRRAADWLTVATPALPQVRYRAGLEKRLPTDQNRHELSPMEALRLLEEVARTNRLFYLHPSFGHFFEGFYLEPAGTIFEMKRRGKDSVDLRPLPDAVVAANEHFWTQLWDRELSALVPPAKGPASAATIKLHLGVVAASRDEDRLPDEWYSVSLEAWAVALQEQGRLREAQVRFEQVLQLNSSNTSARISLACNTNLQAGVQLQPTDVRQLANWLGNLDLLQVLLKKDGPFDEPTFDYLMGVDFWKHGQWLQAGEQLQRARSLVPSWTAPQIALADVFDRLQKPERSRPLIEQLREEKQKGPPSAAADLNLALLDSYAWLLQTNANNARDVLQSLVKEHPDDPEIAGRVIGAYLAFGDYTNALQVIEGRLAKKPDDIPTLNIKADILVQTGHAADAIPVLDRVVALTNVPAARLNRAFGRIAAQDFARATKEFNELEKEGSHSARLDFGFALLAEHAGDTNSAKHYLQLCVSNTPPGAVLWRAASAELQGLQSK
jgi:predicted Zn-dependent protease